MRTGGMRSIEVLLCLLAVCLVAAASLRAAREDDEPASMGPATVILDELEDTFEPVPFDHLAHAQMAEMWDGCVTCHHRSPHPEATTETLTLEPISQDRASAIPACRSCHPATGGDVDIHMPGLKGAYHRQCLNCHQDWMHENACAICHLPKADGPAPQAMPAVDDIVGRMHPPIPEPDNKHYEMRFTPVAGGNVLFRHRRHTIDYGIECVSCHRHDNCASCHGAGGTTTAPRPLHPGRTWNESHGPCIACHAEDRCAHCHYPDDGEPPVPFEHQFTGQRLDEEHTQIACAQCHESLDYVRTPVCGSTECHGTRDIRYPTDLPGPEPAWVLPTPVVPTDGGGS